MPVQFLFPEMTSEPPFQKVRSQVFSLTGLQALILRRFLTPCLLVKAEKEFISIFKNLLYVTLEILDV